MKIQAHPPRPAVPDISMIPRASSPPKAPAAVAAEKKMAIRNPHSWRRYHMVMLREGVRWLVSNPVPDAEMNVLVGDSWE